jgi:peptide/nickel transport system permease protein
MKKFLTYLRTRPLGYGSAVLIILLYLIMAFAEFIAPYQATKSFPACSYCPPNVHITSKGLVVQDTVAVNRLTWTYVRIKGQYHDIKFFAKGEPYKLWGLIPLERHLFTTTDGSPVFLLGADGLGRDMFSRIVYGSRISLTIGIVATFISILLSVFFGGIAGYFGGKTDWTVMRVCEFLMLIPGLYLILFLRSLMGSNLDPGTTYMMVTLLLALVGWPGSARTIRGMVHSIKREEFIQNSQLEMLPSAVIIKDEIMPQIASLLIVSVALSIPGYIMSETTLSYLGLGISDPAVSWGSLINRDVSTISNLTNYPWLQIPIWLLLIVSLAFNFFGDVLRDYYDPYNTIFFKFPWPWRKGKKNQGNLKTEMQNGDTGPVLAREPCPHAGAFPLQDTRIPILPDSFPISRSNALSFLSVRDLVVTFSVLRGAEETFIHAVRGVSFDLQKGEILGIVGESGSGKTVTTQAVPGLLPKTARVTGSVLYNGQELLGLDAKALRQYRGRKIGMIFQEPGRSNDPLQTIEKAFLETFRNSEPGISKEESRKRALALLNEVGLDKAEERLKNFPHQFSGGQLQRIGIALALAQDCELLIADEPTTALDVTIQKQIVELLQSLRERRKISIIFISHDIDLVAGIADRIVVMYGGLVMESGSCKTLMNRESDTGTGAKHPYTRALLAASPAFGSHYSRERLAAIPGKVSDPAHPEPGCPFAPRCSRAGDACTKAIPELRTVGEGHELRCIL